MSFTHSTAHQLIFSLYTWQLNAATALHEAGDDLDRFSSLKKDLYTLLEGYACEDLRFIVAGSVEEVAYVTVYGHDYLYVQQEYLPVPMRYVKLQHLVSSVQAVLQSHCPADEVLKAQSVGEVKPIDPAILRQRTVEPAAPAFLKLTLADIEKAIVNEQYCWFPGTTVTVCCLTVRNGYAVTGYQYGAGESMCQDPAEFNPEEGRRRARARAIDELWKVMSHLRREDEYRVRQP